ncbi:MAG: cyclic nucleotide-binding domain-containing protein [Desulfobacterales bacterium]|nr:cyclic nucleotide-binding domain-containing protein [Desulfobacterales bacterium]
MSVEHQLLESLSFFEDLQIEELQEFASLLSLMSVKKGDVVIKKGTPALTFYIIFKGVFEISFEGRAAITIDKKGEILGWSTVVAPFQYTGTVTATKDGELLYISNRDFITLIQGNNALGEKVVRKINKVATERRAAFSSTK